MELVFEESSPNKTVFPLSRFKSFLEKVISIKHPKKSSNEIAIILQVIIAKLKPCINETAKTLNVKHLIELSKSLSTSSETDNDIYASIYEVFETSSSRIQNVLLKCKSRLLELKEHDLVTELEWVLMSLESMFMSVPLHKQIDDEKEEELLKQYSLDVFEQYREYDIKKVKELHKMRESKSKRKRHHMRGMSSIQGGNLDNPFEKFESKSKEIANDVKMKLGGIEEVANEEGNSTVGMKFERKNKKSATVIHKERMKIQRNILDFTNVKESSIKNVAGGLGGRGQKRSSFKRGNEFKNQLGKDKQIELEPENQPILEFESPTNSPTSKKTSENTIKYENKETHINPQIQKDLLNIPQLHEFSEFDDMNFNIFTYINKVGREKVLYSMSHCIFSLFSLFNNNLLNQDNFINFIDRIRLGYDNIIPYHNDLHASDVLQTANTFISNSSLIKDLDLTSLDISSLFLSCIIHDYKHPGFTNSYLTISNDPISIKFNGISVLQQYHISSAFKALSKPNSNILSFLSNEEFRFLKKRMVDCVLSTDMSKHESIYNNIKQKFTQLQPLTTKTGNSLCELLVQYVDEQEKFKRQQDVLNCIIHCCDLSNNAKTFEISRKWSDLLTEELYHQGDIERKKGLPVSYMCDRYESENAFYQMNLIKRIVLPLYEVMEDIVPYVKRYGSNLEENIEKWKELIEMEEN